MTGVSWRTFQTWAVVVAIAAFVVVLIAGGIATAYYFGREPTRTPEPKLAKLHSKLNIAISKASGKSRQVVSITDPLALPVKAGDLMYLDVRNTEPAHTFLLWLDASGKVIPLYPWNMDELENRDLKTAPPACQKAPVILSPMTIGKGWKFEKGAGMVTLLLLARNTPDGEKVAFDKLLGTVAPVKTRDPAELVVLQLERSSANVKVLEANNRGSDAEAKEADRPLLAMMERLHTEFDLVQAVRFAQVED